MAETGRGTPGSRVGWHACLLAFHLLLQYGCLPRPHRPQILSCPPSECLTLETSPSARRLNKVHITRPVRVYFFPFYLLHFLQPIPLRCSWQFPSQPRKFTFLFSLNTGVFPSLFTDAYHLYCPKQLGPALRRKALLCSYSDVAFELSSFKFHLESQESFRSVWAGGGWKGLANKVGSGICIPCKI